MAGLFAWWQSRHPDGSIEGPATTTPASEEGIAFGVAKIWLITTAVALLLKTVPMLYWGDPWGERHAEFRLFLGALGLYGLCRLPLRRWRSAYLNSASFAMVGSALAVSCALALWLVLVKGSDAAPTNRIPWACALAISSCTLLALSQVTADLRLRYVWVAASFAGLLAVMTSDTRGAYGIALAWPALAIYFFRIKPAATVPRSRIKHALLAAAALLVITVLIPTVFIQKPLQRIQLAWVETSSSSSAEGANTSVGARLHMWQQSLEAIKESPWIGHGREGRMARIRQWGAEANSSTIKGLGHLHNEYLQTLMDHGLWGLSSFLSYILGMLLITRKLAASDNVRHKALAAGMASVAFLLVSSSLSNMNFAHNYYPTVLSLAVTLLVWASAHACSKESPAQG